MTTKPTKILDTFDNPKPARDYEIAFTCPEFTCLCPKTGQPDFATIRIVYVPDQTCVELKSLKLYLWSFRDEGHFHEAVTNRILDDLVAATSPRRMTIEGDFWVRGGITTKVTATFVKSVSEAPTKSPSASGSRRSAAPRAGSAGPRPASRRVQGR